MILHSQSPATDASQILKYKRRLPEVDEPSHSNYKLHQKLFSQSSEAFPFLASKLIPKRETVYVINKNLRVNITKERPKKYLHCQLARQFIGSIQGLCTFTEFPLVVNYYLRELNISCSNSIMLFPLVQTINQSNTCHAPDKKVINTEINTKLSSKIIFH